MQNVQSAEQDIRFANGSPSLSLRYAEQIEATKHLSGKVGKILGCDYEWFIEGCRYLRSGGEDEWWK